jgi:type IV secretion system protein TrbF
MESEFYLQARRGWDERYGDLVLGKRNWQIASAGLMLLSLVLALGIVWMSLRSKAIPYIVEVDKLGYAITIPTALTASNTPATVERMKRYEIAAFIRNARSVCSDPIVEQNMLNDLLAHAHGAANKFLESYFHADDFAENPFRIMKHQTVNVQIESILQASPRNDRCDRKLKLLHYRILDRQGDSLPAERKAGRSSRGILRGNKDQRYSIAT